MTDRRITISDVAREAGVSIGAVSNAMNGRKGVSAETRSRVLETAERLGWTPSAVARSLMGARTRTVGLILTQDLSGVPGTSYYARFVSGLQAALAERDHALLLQVAPPSSQDAEAHRRWLAQRRLDGVVVMDLRVGDPRIEALSAPGGPPAVVVGDPSGSNGLPTVWVDGAGAMRDAVAYLARIGHRRIVRLAGPQDRVSTVVKDEAFAAACLELKIDGAIVRTTGSGEDAMSVTRRLLSARARPTALLYADDLVAVGGLSVTAEMGLRVPQDVSLVGWYDSALTRMTFPALTAVGWDVGEVGRTAAALLVDLLDGAPADSIRVAVPDLLVRGSTGPSNVPR